MNRRDALKRVAVVGGAAVWTAPAVQRLGMLAAHAVSPPPSPPPPASPPPTSPPPPTPTFTGISYIGLVFVCNGTTFRAKWQAQGGWNDIGGNSLPQCPTPAGWSGATVYPNAAAIGVSTTYIGGELYQVTFTLPATCTSSSGSGVAKGGNPNPNNSSDGFCVGGVVGADPRIITFTAPAT